MANEVGKRYECKKCGSEFIVTRGGKGELECCGQKMELKKQLQHKEKKMSQLGKRYRCDKCETEILCTKAGENNPACCEKEMELQEPKPLPSSDQTDTVLKFNRSNLCMFRSGPQAVQYTQKGRTALILSTSAFIRWVSPFVSNPSQFIDGKIATN